jgi:hypothetical protein
MSAREQAAIIAAAVRASLQQIANSGQSLTEALALGVDRAIGNNAAQALMLADESEAS